MLDGCVFVAGQTPCPLFRFTPCGGRIALFTLTPPVMIVGADAERSYSRRRGVTAALTPLFASRGSPPRKEGCAKPEVHPVPASRQKKAVPFRFCRGGESSTSAAPSFLPKLRPFTGSQFGFRGFRPRHYLDDGGHWFTDTLCKDGQGLPPLQRKEHPVRWIGRVPLLLFCFCF